MRLSLHSLKLLLIGGAVFLGGCGESPTTTTADSGSLGADVAAEADAPGGEEDSAAGDSGDSVGVLDSGTPAPDSLGSDTSAPIDTGAGDGATSDTGCGEAGCVCKDGSTCNSGFCIEVNGQNQCAALCAGGCAEGFKCTQVTGVGGDAVSICTPAAPRICEPCNADSDCSNVMGGSDNRCVSYKDPAGVLLGHFCTAACGADAACPTGYSCQDTVSLGGVQGKQCVRTDLTCPCDARAISLKLATSCQSGNAIGLCGGKRACGDSGLSACDAPSALTETCDGKDNDCDGDTDEPTAGMCDDGSPCSYDNCVAKACQNPPKAGPCNDGSACTQNDKCVGVECVGTVVVCDDKNPCTADSCDPASGCSSTAAGSAACSDGSVCTEGDTCKDGTCIAGAAINCDDGNPCTDDACDAQKGCTSVNNTATCDDGVACTSDELCKGGLCVPTVFGNCDDNNPCTTDVCAAKNGCQHSDNTLPCDDGSVCTTADVCKGGACIPGKPALCNDGNPCTTDSCDASNGCNFAANSAACSDGNVCTEGDVCQDGACAPGSLKDCDDGNPCTIDTCDAKAGCKWTNHSQPCDDGNVCTLGDKCNEGSCLFGKPVQCDDGNPCTDDSCDPGIGCQHEINAAKCDDNNPCTTGDFCKGGVCAPAGTSTCDDNNPCTTENCDPFKGCTSTPNSLPCSDGNVCTLGDACKGGACGVGFAVVCNDGNPCTDDSCDPLKGCQQTPNSAPCDDGNACSTAEQCKDGVCAVMALANCDDGNVCTTEQCDFKKGCISTNNAAGCSDGNACTGNDLCSDGKCAAGQPLTCNDGNPCTDDSCNPLSGCAHANNTAPCSDGNGCTVSDTCSAGQCKAGAACGANASCEVSGAGQACVCKSGYSGDGVTCSDINECLTNNGGCSANANCTNSAGSFSCACKPGYTGDGKVCNMSLGANEIAYNGFAYRTLDDAPPKAGYGAWVNTCQTSYIAMPAGYTLVPEEQGIISNVVAQNIWSTHCILFSTGVSYGVQTYNNGGNCGCSGSQCLGQQGNSYAALSCSRRILIRRPL